MLLRLHFTVEEITHSMLCWKWGPRHSGPQRAVSVPATQHRVGAAETPPPVRAWGGLDLCPGAQCSPEGSLFIRKARAPYGRQRTGGLRGKGHLDRRSHPGPGSWSRHRALPFREGSGDLWGSGVTPDCLALVGFLPGAHRVWSPLGRPCCGITFGRRGRRAAGLPPAWFSAPSGFH